MFREEFRITVKLSRDPGTPIKYLHLHSYVERSRDPGTKTTVIYSSLKNSFLLFEPLDEKTCFCICANKGADQLPCNGAADHHLYFY